MQISQDTRLSFLPLTITDPDNELIEIAFNYRLADPHEYRLPDPKLIDYLNELTDNEGISAIILGTDFDEIGYTTTYFVKGETYQLDQVIADNLSWDDSHEENYIAVDNPKHPIHMFHSDYTTRRTIIRPWHHITDYFRSFSGTYKVYLYTPTKAGKYASNPRMHEFLDPLDGFIAQYHTSDVADLIKTNYFQSHSPEIIIVVTSLLIVFLYILFVFDHNKEISVRKLNGQSEIRIVWDLLAPLNILLLSGFLVTTLGLIIYYKTGFNPLSFALYRKMGLIGIVLLVGLICASSTAWFYIRRVNYSSLKNTGKQSQTSFVMHAVKVLILIISISFIASLTDINRGYEYNKEYLKTYPSNSFYTVLLRPEAKNYGVSYDDLRHAMADQTVFLETIQMADLESLEEGKPATFLFQSVVANLKIADYADIILADGKVFSPKPGKNYLLYPDGMDPMAYFSFPGINQTSEGVEVLEMHPPTAYSFTA